MPGPHRPRFVATSQFDISLDWAAQPWRPFHAGPGGMKRAGSGIGASYSARRDRFLGLRIRVQEYERAAMEAAIEWMQMMAYFTVYLDASDAGTSYLVDLESPAFGERWEWERDSQYPHQFFLDLVLRKADGSAWTDEYFIS